MRAARLRRQRERRDRKVRGQSGAPREPRPQLREGPRDTQSGRRSRTDPLPAPTRRRTRGRWVGADQLGRRTRRDRITDPDRTDRGSPRRDHVPRRPSRRGRLRRAGAQGLGRRRAQQPHQHLLIERAHRIPVVDGSRPAVGRLRQRRGDLPHLVASRGRALLQPARPADHRGAATRCHRDLRRPATVEYGLEGRPLVADVAGHRGLPRPVDRARVARERNVGARLRAPVGELGDLPRRGAPRTPARVRLGRTGPARPVRRVHPGARRAHHRDTRRQDPRDRDDHRCPPDEVRLAQLAGRGGRQPRWLAGRPLPLLHQRAHRIGRHQGWHQWERLEQVRAGPAQGRPTAQPVERTELAARVSTLLPRDVDPAAALPQRGTGQARHLLLPGLQPDLDKPGRLQLARGADRHRQGGLSRRADPDLVGDRLVRRLRAAYGCRRRATRSRQLRDPCRALDRLPSAGDAALRGVARRGTRFVDPHLRVQPG